MPQMIFGRKCVRYTIRLMLLLSVSLITTSGFGQNTGSGPQNREGLGRVEASPVKGQTLRRRKSATGSTAKSVPSTNAKLERLLSDLVAEQRKANEQNARRATNDTGSTPLWNEPWVGLIVSLFGPLLLGYVIFRASNRTMRQQEVLTQEWTATLSKYWKEQIGTSEFLATQIAALIITDPKVNAELENRTWYGARRTPKVAAVHDRIMVLVKEAEDVVIDWVDANRQCRCEPRSAKLRAQLNQLDPAETSCLANRLQAALRPSESAQKSGVSLPDWIESMLRRWKLSSSGAEDRTPGKCSSAHCSSNQSNELHSQAGNSHQPGSPESVPSEVPRDEEKAVATTTNGMTVSTQSSPHPNDIDAAQTLKLH